MSFKSIIAIYFIFTFIISCSREVSTIKIILPDGYKGLIEIVEDSNEIVRIETVEDHIELHIPDNGVFRCKSIKIFESPFRPEPIYLSGDPIKVATLQDENITWNAFWLINQPTIRRMYFFVGTLEELQNYDFRNPNIYSPDYGSNE